MEMGVRNQVGMSWKGKGKRREETAEGEDGATVGERERGEEEDIVRTTQAERGVERFCHVGPRET